MNFSLAGATNCCWNRKRVVICGVTAAKPGGFGISNIVPPMEIGLDQPVAGINDSEIREEMKTLLFEITFIIVSLGY